MMTEKIIKYGDSFIEIYGIYTRQDLQEIIDSMDKANQSAKQAVTDPKRVNLAGLD